MGEMLLAKGLLLLGPKEILKFLLIVLAECELKLLLSYYFGNKGEEFVLLHREGLLSIYKDNILRFTS